MPIEFTVNHESSYFTTKYIGKVSEDEVIDLYTTFFEDDGWAPGLNELVDHSELDGSNLNGDGLRKIAMFASYFYKEHNISNVKTAIFAPKDLPFGLSRIYDVMTDDSPEEVGVFRDMQEAKSWLGI